MNSRKVQFETYALLPNEEEIEVTVSATVTFGHSPTCIGGEYIDAGADDEAEIEVHCGKADVTDRLDGRTRKRIETDAIERAREEAYESLWEIDYA